MTHTPAPPDIGVPAKTTPGKWVQTERAAHEEWAKLSLRKPVAGAVLHKLVAYMGHQNAVVISQKVLAAMLGVHERSIRRAVADLVSAQWIQTVRMGKGKEVAYVVNDKVAWGQSRSDLRLSAFSATIIADAEDQDAATLNQTPLRRIPVLFPGEGQLPVGDGLPPPSQPFLPDMEPDMPAIEQPDGTED